MKAKDLTQADVGKYVMLRGKIIAVHSNVQIEIEGDLDDDGDQDWAFINFDTTLEFTDPPAPVQEVGDVFKNIGDNPVEWTIGFIDGDVCIMRYLTGHVSADYPLNPALWKFVRKGTNP
jgi:hypothetical protein